MAYGYAMSGDTLAECAIPSVVTTILFSTTTFKGARFQTVTADTSLLETTTITSVNLGTYIEAWGENSLYTKTCLLYTSPSPRDGLLSRMPSSA